MRICSARIARHAPFLDRRDVVERQRALLGENADERAGDALPFRPADLRRVFRPARRVPLADNLAAIDEHDRAGILRRLRHAPVERRLHDVRPDVGKRCRRVEVAHRPRLLGRVGQISRNGHRLEMNLGLAARHDRATLIAVVFRHAGRDPVAAHGNGVTLRIDREREVLLPAEQAERSDVLRQDLLRRALVRSPDHPETRAEVMRADRRSRFPTVGEIERARGLSIRAERDDCQQRN